MEHETQRMFSEPNRKHSEKSCKSYNPANQGSDKQEANTKQTKMEQETQRKILKNPRIQ